MPDIAALLAANPFAGDDGSIEPAMAEAFKQEPFFRAEAVVAALANNGRVLVAAAPHSDPGKNEDGTIAAHATSADPLSRPDGIIRVNFSPTRFAYAIFSSAASYGEFVKRFNLSAQVRPVPVKARDAAALGLARGQGMLVLDPGSANQQWIGRSALLAVASGEEWLAPWDDPQIAEHIMGALPGAVPGLEKVTVDPGEAGKALVTIYLLFGASREQAEHIVTVVSDIVASEPYVKARLDAVELRPMWGGA